MGGFFDAAEGAGTEGGGSVQFVAGGGLAEADTRCVVEGYHLIVFYIIVDA